MRTPFYIPDQLFVGVKNFQKEIYILGSEMHSDNPDDHFECVEVLMFEVLKFVRLKVC